MTRTDDRETPSRTPHVRHQHYVSQFYLKRFAGVDHLIRSLDLHSRRLPKPKGPARLCQDDYFYGIETGASDEVSQRIERGFQSVETTIADGLSAVDLKIADRRPIVNSDKHVLSLLMSSLWVRGPAMRRRVSHLNTMIDQKLRNLAAWPSRDPDGKQTTVTTNAYGASVSDVVALLESERLPRDQSGQPRWKNTPHLDLLNGIPRFASHFADQYWTILINASGMPFVTSDNPVAEFDPPMLESRGSEFSQRTHYFALSPLVCIVCTPPPPSAPRRTVKRRTLFSQDAALVRSVNLSIASRSLQYVYASDSLPLVAILEDSKEFVRTTS